VRAEHTPVSIGGGRVHLVTGAERDRALARLQALRGCAGLTR